jgi:hypothetical protein
MSKKLNKEQYDVIASMTRKGDKFTRSQQKSIDAARKEYYPSGNNQTSDSNEGAGVAAYLLAGGIIVAFIWWLFQ